MRDFAKFPLTVLSKTEFPRTALIESQRWPN